MSLVQNFNSSSFRNYFSAFLTELIIMVMSVLLYRFCLLRFGEDDFSIYSIYRRGFSFLQPLLMIGLGVGIPRFISLHFRDKKRIAGYYSAATIIILMICAISSVLLFIFSRHISAFVFGAEFYEYLIPPLILMLIGVLVYNISYSYYRGILNMKLANLFQFLFLGIIPVVSVFASSSLVNALYLNGILWCAFAVIGWFWAWTEVGKVFFCDKGLFTEIFLYGIYRLPGDIAIGFFFLLPVIVIVQQSGDTVLAGYVAFSVTLINLVGSVFTPICVVLLAQSGNYIADKKYNDLRKLAFKLIYLVLLLVLPGIIVFEWLAEPILKIYLGSVNELLLYICRISILATLGYSLYISLRSIPDALFVRPVNSFYIVISIAVFILIAVWDFWIGHSFENILIGFVGTLTLLGILTTIKTLSSLNHFIKNNKI